METLLSAAEDLSAEAVESPTAAPASPGAAPSGSAEVPAPGTDAPSGGSPATPRARGELDRILQVKVPVIVRLAEQDMPLERILGIKVGSIIEFDRSFDAELDLLVANWQIATGQAVKVGENFGLRLTQIGDLGNTIRALGGE